MDIPKPWFELGIALALILSLLGAAEAGYIGGKRKQRGEADRGQVGAVQAGLLGLLGLLLGFSFAGAAGRFGERGALVVREANALGTAYLRCDLLPDAQRDEARALLRSYAELRIEMGRAVGTPGSAEIGARMIALQERLWSAAVGGVRANPAATMAVLPPINEVIDHYTDRQAALRRHLPPLVMGLLIACALIGTFSIGFGNGLSGKRHAVMTAAFTLLVAAALWTTIDLDYPRRGLIQVDHSALLAAREGMGR